MTEVFNEMSILILLYTLMLLTHYVPEAVTRYGIGYFYIAIAGFNLFVHLVIITKVTIYSIVQFFKNRQIRKTILEQQKLKKAKKKNEKPKEKPKEKSELDVIPEEEDKEMSENSISVSICSSSESEELEETKLKE